LKGDDKMIKNVGLFLGGLVIGAIVTYKLMEKKMYEEIDREIENITIKMEEKYMNPGKEYNFTEEEEEEKDEEDIQIGDLDYLEEYGTKAITKEDYDNSISTHQRVDAVYYMVDDIFVDAKTKDIIEIDIPADLFNFKKRFEYFKDYDEKKIYKLRYVNKSYAEEIGFSTPSKK